MRHRATYRIYGIAKGIRVLPCVKARRLGSNRSTTILPLGSGRTRRGIMGECEFCPEASRTVCRRVLSPREVMEDTIR